MGKELMTFWKVLSICSTTREMSKVIQEVDFGGQKRKLIQSIYDLAVSVKLYVTLFASDKPLGSKMGPRSTGAN
jgi:hypothetical protein